jgi:hypothetical protein
MTKIDESQMKVALSAIKEARRAHPNLSYTRMPTDQRAIEEFFGPVLNRIGLDAGKFDELRAQNQIEFRRILEKQKADAVRESSSARVNLRRGLENRRKALEHRVTRTPPLTAPTTFPFYIILDTPFLIWTTPGMFFDTWHIEPENNWAKIKVEKSQAPPLPYDTGFEGSEELSFYFFWQNPSDKAWAVINVDSYLVFNGFCEVKAPGGFFAGDRWSSLSIDANLYLLEWWNQPPTQPSPQTSQNMLSLSVSAYGMFDSDKYASKALYRGCDLSYEFFLVPPSGVTVFEAAANVSFGFGQDNGGHGYAHADFDSGDFEVMCPEMLIAILEYIEDIR